MDRIYPKEKTLFALSLAVSAVFWLIVLAATLGTALVYVALYFVAYLFAHSGLICYLRGNAVRISETQFPDLHARLEQCCERLGMRLPEAYVLQAGGALNAFATRFLGRNFVVLYSDVLEALEERPDALNFYLGHELGHIHRNHLRWAPVLFPAGLLPLLGAAYSRAREYTCDRYGLDCCAALEDAEVAVGALAAGKRWRLLSGQHFAEQSSNTEGFWMSFHELLSDYPWLTKRMAAIRALAAGRVAAHPARHALAWALAAFCPRTGLPAGGGGLVVIAVIGMLAAIAIPQYQRYVERAKQAAGSRELRPLEAAPNAPQGVFDHAEDASR
jgi:Zn-dependent protease with chaperone function